MVLRLLARFARHPLCILPTAGDAAQGRTQADHQQDQHHHLDMAHWQGRAGPQPSKGLEPCQQLHLRSRLWLQVSGRVGAGSKEPASCLLVHQPPLSCWCQCRCQPTATGES